MISRILEVLFPTDPSAILKPLLKLVDKLEACIDRNVAKAQEHKDRIVKAEAAITNHEGNVAHAQQVLENIKKIVQ